ncbi:MAG: type II toxin-antitoxin system HicB family antitoxin [Bacteroidota bacterium]
MGNLRQFTAIIEREDDQYVALCPELDLESQGASVEEARRNLKEALEVFFETASQQEIRERLHEEVFVTRLEVAVG